MKLLKKIKRKKRVVLHNEFQMDPKSKIIWELLEENDKLKRRLEELENEKNSKRLQRVWQRFKM